MNAPRCAVLVVLALLAAGCAGLGGRDTAVGPGGAARDAAVVQGRLLAGLERTHPGLVLTPEAARGAERAGREALAVPAGDRTYWEDVASSTRGSFLALRDYTSAAGSACRELLAGVVTPSGTYTAPTLACRRTDGRWYVLD